MTDIPRTAIELVNESWKGDNAHTPPGYPQVFQTTVLGIEKVERVVFVTTSQDVHLGLGRMSLAVQQSLAALLMFRMSTYANRMFTVCYWDREILVTQVAETQEGRATLHLSPIKVSHGHGSGGH